MSELKWKRGGSGFYPDAYQHALWMGLTYSICRKQIGRAWWYTLYVDGTYLQGRWVMRKLKEWLASELTAPTREATA